jgi:hypothetical protein
MTFTLLNNTIASIKVKSRPPTFALFCNMRVIPGFFERFLRASIQRDFSLQGVPIRFIIKKTTGSPAQQMKLSQGKHSRRGIGKGSSRPVGKKRLDSSLLRKLRQKRFEERKKGRRLRSKQKS